MLYLFLIVLWYQGTKQIRKWHRHHKLSRKKIVWVAGLRMGRAKEFERTSARVRGRKKKGSPPFHSRVRKSLSLSLLRRPRKDSKRLGTLSARLTAKKLCDMSSSNMRRRCPSCIWGRWKGYNKVTQIQKLSFCSFFYCIFAVMLFLIFPFVNRGTSPRYISGSSKARFINLNIIHV